VTPPFSVQYDVPPTPDEGEIFNTPQPITIQFASNRNLASADLVLSDNGGTNGNNSFEITMDETLWNKWEFKYPVTYVFDLSGVPIDAGVLRRDDPSDPWEPLEEKTSSDFFNGIECVRFESSENKAYVSVGFNTSNTIYLQFQNIPFVDYDSIAKYYDNRKAAYTLSNDNWGRNSSANPGVPCSSMTDDSCDNYQAAVKACRMYNLPISIAINSQMAGGSSMWDRMQNELDVGDNIFEPAIHTRTHACSVSAYGGYVGEILGCRDDILANLTTNIPYGQHVFNFILPCGYQDATLESTSAGEFIFIRDWDSGDHPGSTDYAPWNSTYNYYGIGGFQTKAYDPIFQSRSPSGRYYASDVTTLNNAFDTVYNSGGIFYAMWHSDRYQNSVIHSTDPPVEGVSGSSLMQHFEHVANRNDMWYVANG